MLHTLLVKLVLVAIKTLITKFLNRKSKIFDLKYLHDVKDDIKDFLRRSISLD